MANVSKVIYEGAVIIDLTSDTVDEMNLLKGYKAHRYDGKVITGKAVSYEGDPVFIDFSVSDNILNIRTNGYGNQDVLMGFTFEGNHTMEE